MSLKEKVELWQAGVNNATAGKFEEAVDSFTEIPEPSARIYFNIASAFLRMGNLEDAERNLDLCVNRDPHMALGFFQRGCLYLQKQRFVDALKDFDSTLNNLRGNLLIDYKQLGLQYKLYSCEVLYNKAYAKLQLRDRDQCMEILLNAKELASGASESRHRIISNALEALRAGQSFMPYRLPKACMWFSPPTNKVDVLKPVNFLKPAKVVSSIVDQDAYTGFVGAQDKKLRTPSPKAHRRHSPPSGASSSRAAKPDVPPPSRTTSMKIESREASLKGNGGQPLILPKRGSSKNLFSSQFISASPVTSKSPPPLNRPAKPASPSPCGGSKSPTQGARPNGLLTGRKPAVKASRSNGGAHQAVRKSSQASPVRSPTPSSPETTMTVKVHYTTTRALRVLVSTTFNQLVQVISHKFNQPDGSLTLWYKSAGGELEEVMNDDSLRVAISNLEDGFRLTLWAYDRNDADFEIIKEVLAIADYTAQYEDELTFNAGDKIQITLEINDDWYEGQCNGGTGIFPRSFVRDT